MVPFLFPDLKLLSNAEQLEYFISEMGELFFFIYKIVKTFGLMG